MDCYKLCPGYVEDTLDSFGMLVFGSWVRHVSVLGKVTVSGLG
jgi:hypothetical protein